MSKSRTKNVSRNAAVAVICQVTNLLLLFVTRTIFIKVLGAEYLGVNGLFTNILTILSFAELGIGNAIVFSMYKPLAIGDTNKIKSLMRLYRKAYILIGIIVAGVGISVIPFLDIIIKGKPDIPESISLLYVLFLVNTVVSYFFAYKRSIIVADQKNYIVLVVAQVAVITKTALQIGFLFLTHQYITYLGIQILFTIIENGICSIIADRLYPYLKEPATPLDKTESKQIFTNVRALALYKFGTVILNGTDNILISALISVRDVGLASNYVLLATSCNSILQRITEVFISSVGNLNATEGSDKQYDIFKKLFFLTSWMFGFASVGLLTVTQHFIRVWIGDEYLLTKIVLFAIVSEFYVKGVHSVAYTYRSTLGYFVEGKWSAILASVINLVLSIILCKRMGIAGIFIATPIARILSIGIVDPVLIFNKGFKRNVFEYYLTYLMYLLVYSGIGLFCSYILCFISVKGWIGVFIDILVVTVLFNSSVILVFHRTKILKGLLQMGLTVVKRKKT